MSSSAQIAAGNMHFAALTDEAKNNAFCWGANHRGQCAIRCVIRHVSSTVVASLCLPLCLLGRLPRWHSSVVDSCGRLPLAALVSRHTTQPIARDDVEGVWLGSLDGPERVVARPPFSWDLSALHLPWCRPARPRRLFAPRQPQTSARGVLGTTGGPL